MSSQRPRSVWARRAVYSFLITAVGLTATYSSLVVAHDPHKWYYNATANGFLLFTTSILAVVFGVPLWWLTFGVLTSLGIPKDRPGAGDAPG